MVEWSIETYTVTFVENNLPTGTNWSVTLGGTARSTNQTSIAFTEANGTYSYGLGSVPGWATSRYTGTVAVDGAELSEVFHWSPVTYLVAFVESGLLAGTTWSVVLDGVTESGTGLYLTFLAVPNGTYEFTIGPLPGYDVTPSLGSVTVHGLQVFQVITFKSSSSPVLFLGLPATEGYGVLGGIVVAILVVTMAVLLLRRRGRRAPPEPAKTATPADPTESPVSP